MIKTVGHGAPCPVADPEVRNLAATMIDVQTREITVMQNWLLTWFGT